MITPVIKALVEGMGVHPLTTMNKKKERDIFAPIHEGTWDKAVEALEKKNAFRPDDGVITRIPTYSLKLDVVLEGGWPDSGLIEFTGEPGVGKTTIATENAGHYAAAKQRKILHQDYELNGDEKRVDYLTSRFHYNFLADHKKSVKQRHYVFQQPMYAEDGRQLAMALLITGEVGVLVTDSVGAIRPREAVDKAISGGNIQKGLHAATISEMVSVYFSLMKQHRALWIAVNQLRDHFVIGGWSSPGAPKTKSTGGRMFKYMTSVSLQIRRGAKLDSGGRVCILDIQKNKLTGWTGRVNLSVRDDASFRWEEEVLTYGRKYDLIDRKRTRGGVRYTVNVSKNTKSMKEDDLLEWIHTHPAFRSLVRARTLKAELK